MKTFVIAGTKHEADYWIINDLSKRYPSNTSISMSDYVYVSSPEKLKSISDPHGVFVGTWYERSDMLEVIQTLRHRTRVRNEKLNIIMDLYMQYRLGVEK
jgi:hypothetical protein